MWPKCAFGDQKGLIRKVPCDAPGSKVRSRLRNTCATDSSHSRLARFSTLTEASQRFLRHSTEVSLQCSLKVSVKILHVVFIIHSENGGRMQYFVREQQHRH